MASHVATRNSMVVLVPCGTGPVQAKVGQHLSAVLPSLGGWWGGGSSPSIQNQPVQLTGTSMGVWTCLFGCNPVFFLSVSGWDESLWD